MKKKGGMDMHELTLRCLIRPFKREDVQDVFAFASNPDVARSANFTPHRSLLQTQEILDRWIMANDIFAIELSEETKVIGAISFRSDIASPIGWYKIGYTCHPDYQGKGYVNETLRKVMDHLFYDQNTLGIALHIFADNLASIRTALRAGFPASVESFIKVRVDGTSVAECVYRIKRDHYKAKFGGKWFGEIRSTQIKNASEDKIIYRHAVRGIPMRNNEILMVRSSGGDVKFPGGGIKADETKEDALKREVLEETGYRVKKINRHRGYIEEFTDAFESAEHVFSMRSDYYDIEVEEQRTELNLDDYEAGLGFHPVWMTLDQAIEANEKCVAPKRWTKRDTRILRFLKHVEETLRQEE
jgi:RimJ/RimL family protein N-acetyltransferase/8-oxo-dGTP pyrophosphatase MutT (NUDIX family)